jgi:predicted alpha/beta superfamily hydrolase
MPVPLFDEGIPVRLLRLMSMTLLLAWLCAGQARAVTPVSASAPAPLVIGDTWTIASSRLGETRRINVVRPPGIPAGQALPVMVMPDGGLQEDFLHVAGLLQVGAGNGTVRPFLLVGIENTERRRDLTGPTGSARDRAIAPRVGGSQAFRDFIRTELLPEVRKRYPTTGETAIVGESLAGLFVVETLALEPDLFDTYIAIDPSLWWNDGGLARRLASDPPALKGRKTVYLALSSDGLATYDAAAVAAGLRRTPGLDFHQDEWPGETHATIYHPAALKAFRAVLGPAPAPAH